MEVGTERQIRFLGTMIATVFVLNALDAVFTVYWIVGVETSETNPFMDHLLGIHPMVFVAVKLLLVALGSYLLWRHRRQRVAVVGIFALFIVYYWLLVWHLRGFNEFISPLLFGA